MIIVGCRDANRSYGLVGSIDPLQGGEVALNILLTSVPQTVFTPVFTFTYTCLTLYKHWQQLFFFLLPQFLQSPLLAMDISLNYIREV